MLNTSKIDFGRVSRYVEDKGFGFVSHTLQSQLDGDIFFHIKIIKKSNPDIVKRLENGMFIEDTECDSSKNSSDAICFWYRTEKTNKGMQVNSAININDLYGNEVESLRKIIENIWKKNKYISNCLIHASEDLLGVNRTNELKNKKNDFEIEEQEIYLKDLIEESSLRKNGSETKMLIDGNRITHEIDATKQRLRKLKGTETNYLELIESEYKQIIEEMKPLGFTHSKEVSDYIIKNKLRKKYKNISGVVKMEKEGSSWDFNGGLPRNVYARICQDLDLENEGSNAKAIGFESYNDLYD